MIASHRGDPQPRAVKVIACGAATRRRRAAIPSGADARAGTRASAAPCRARGRVERLRHTADLGTQNDEMKY